MRSTGEVMGLDSSFRRAFLKAQIGAGSPLPETGRVFFSIRDADKTAMLEETARTLHQLGFELVATRGTGAFLQRTGIPCQHVRKVYEGSPNVVDLMKDGKIDLVMNTSDGKQEVEDSKSLRKVALAEGIPYFTTATAAHVVAMAMEDRRKGDLAVRALQEY